MSTMQAMKAVSRLRPDTTIAAAATISVPTAASVIQLAGSDVTVTNILAAPGRIIRVMGNASGVVWLGTTNSPTAAGQMDFGSADAMLANANSSVLLRFDQDGIARPMGQFEIGPAPTLLSAAYVVDTNVLTLTFDVDMSMSTPAVNSLIAHIQAEANEVGLNLTGWGAPSGGPTVWTLTAMGTTSFSGDDETLDYTATPASFKSAHGVPLAAFTGFEVDVT